MHHIPVLLDAVLAFLLPARRLIDGTLGVGGHSRALLEGGAGEILGLDVDPIALEIARTTLSEYSDRVHLAHVSYRHMVEEAAQLGWNQVDGILLDLGVSSVQLDTAERGFAFMKDGPLDMRFDQTGTHPPASELVNYWEEAKLATLLRQYGEEPHSRKLAHAIVAGRPLDTTRQLASVIESVIPRHTRDRIHPATRVFQALRIAVNNELHVLEETLPRAINLLCPGGKLAVISFQSLEDRVVKQTFKLASSDCICPPRTPICVCGHKATVRLVTKKPVVADELEIRRNPRSRSAKLRVVERLSP